MPKIECPDCQGFGYHRDKETKKNTLCKTCWGSKVVEAKPQSSNIWETK